MPIRIRLGRKQDKSLLAKMEGELEIERRPAEGGKERVRVVEVGPWLLYDPKSDTFAGEVTIDIGVLCYNAERLESARETLEFLREHTKEVAEKIIETECRNIDLAWYNERVRQGQKIEVSNIEVTCPNLKFTAILREKTRHPLIEEEEDLEVFSRLVQNLNEGWSDEEVAGVVDELERESR